MLTKTIIVSQWYWNNTEYVTFEREIYTYIACKKIGYGKIENVFFATEIHFYIFWCIKFGTKYIPISKTYHRPLLFTAFIKKKVTNAFIKY